MMVIARKTLNLCALNVVSSFKMPEILRDIRKRSIMAQSIIAISVIINREGKGTCRNTSCTHTILILLSKDHSGTSTNSQMKDLHVHSVVNHSERKVMSRSILRGFTSKSNISVINVIKYIREGPI